MSSRANKVPCRYWDRENPSLTSVVQAEVERVMFHGAKIVHADGTMTIEEGGLKLALDRHGNPVMSIAALEFLWHSTATAEEVRWSDQHDWCSALDQLVMNYAGASSKSQPVGHDPSWPTIIELLRRSSVRPLMRLAFVREWILGSAREVPQALRPDFFRIFFPTYDGSALTLYRGCRSGGELGMSWTDVPDVARKFTRSLAVHGEAFLIETVVPADAIIGDTRPFMRKTSEREIVVDPKRLEAITVLEKQPQRSAPRGGKDVWSNCVTRQLLSSYHKKMQRLREEELREIDIRY